MSVGRKTALFAAGALAISLAAAPASADAVSDFFRNRTVTVQVPPGHGGSIGRYGRLVADHLGRHVPGSPRVAIESPPEASAAGAFGTAPKDGTYIAEAAPAMVADAILHPGAGFDAARCQWIGSLAPRPAVLSVWAATTPARTLAEAEKTPVILGSSGRSAQTYTMPMLMNALLGTKFRMVSGYRSDAEIDQAMVQGEVHGRTQYWSDWTADKPAWLRAHRLIHLVQYGPAIRALPNVPRLTDLVKQPEAKRMAMLMALPNDVGAGFCAPAGVPEDRIAALRNAFAAMLRDGSFLAAARRARVPIDPVGGPALQKTVAAAYAVPPAAIDRLRRIIAGNGRG